MAVSIASGVDQIASIFPVLFGFKVQIALLLILFITLINLRGVKESGRVFAVPTYLFIGMMLLMIGVGLWQAFTGTLGTVQNVPGADHRHAVADRPRLQFPDAAGLQFRHHGPHRRRGDQQRHHRLQAAQSRNAATTLVWDAALLMIMFLGLGILGYLVQAQPSEQEVLISQVARTVYGDGLMRLLTLLSATVILIMAANTSFADFPRLAALHAGDGFLPRQFTFRGSRLVFWLGRHHPGRLCQPADRRLPGQRQPPDPALCHRRLPLLHRSRRQAWPSAGGASAG